VTQQVLLGSQIEKLDVKVRQKLYIVRIYHVAIQSELNYLLGGEIMQQLGPMKDVALL